MNLKATFQTRSKQSSTKIAAITTAIVAALLLGACSATGASSTGQAKVDANAQKIVVSTGSVSNRIVATGKIVAAASAGVAFPRSGVVAEVLVKEGQQVQAGQPLAKLDHTDLDLTAQQQWASYLSAQATYSQSIKGPTAAELKAAQASIASAQASIASAQASKNQLFAEPTEAELVQAKADLQNADVELRSAQSAYDRRNRQDPSSIGASQEAVSLEKATNNYNKAKAAYDAKFQQPTNKDIASANSQISSANSTIQSARKSLEALQPVSETIQQREAQMQQAYFSWQQAQENLKNATLFAPFDGIVTAVTYDKGDYAGAGQSAIVVADFNIPIFEVDVDEADLGGVKVGQEAFVRLQTYPNQRIPAKVESISTVGTSTGAVVNYKVKLTIGKSTSTDNTSTTSTQPVILINMSGTSEIVTAKTDNAVVVPNNTITLDTQTKRYSVNVLKTDNTTQKIEVQLGYRDANQTQILQGINAGDTLIVPARTVQQSGPGGSPN